MSTILLTLGMLLTPPQDSAAAWPRFMGPSGTGAVEVGELNFEWGEAGPEVLWRVELGEGFGGVAVDGDEVFLLDREVGEMDILRVLDAKTGADLWDQAYEAEGRLQYPGSRSVPTLVGDYVVTMGGHGDVACFNRKSRTLKWKLNVAEEFEGELPGYGWSNNPLVIGDMVVISVFGEDVGLVALDIATGEEIWATTPLGISHSTPVLFNLLGEEQILFLSAGEQTTPRGEVGQVTVSSFDPESGELNWDAVVKGSRYPIPCPMQIDGERFFITGGYRGGSSMLKLSKSGGEYKLEEQFHIELGSQMYAPILRDGHLYYLVNENANHQRNLRKTGGLLCIDLEGKEKWRTGDDPFLGRGNWIMGGPYLFLQDGFNGSLVVCKASPEGYEELANFNVFGVTDRKDHENWAPMALVDGKLFLRSKNELACLNLRRAAE